MLVGFVVLGAVVALFIAKGGKAADAPPSPAGCAASIQQVRDRESCAVSQTPSLMRFPGSEYEILYLLCSCPQQPFSMLAANDKPDASLP